MQEVFSFLACKAFLTASLHPPARPNLNELPTAVRTLPTRKPAQQPIMAAWGPQRLDQGI